MSNIDQVNARVTPVCSDIGLTDTAAPLCSGHFLSLQHPFCMANACAATWLDTVFIWAISWCFCMLAESGSLNSLCLFPVPCCCSWQRSCL